MTDRYRAALETVAQWDEWAAQRLRELDAQPPAPAEGPHGEHNDVTPWECVCVDCWEPPAPANRATVDDWVGPETPRMRRIPDDPAIVPTFALDPDGPYVLGYSPLAHPTAPAEGLREAAQAVVDWFADVEGSRLDCLDALRAALKETDREPTGTVARGASPRGLPEHGVSDVPSGSRPPRPPSPPKDREWDGS